MMPEPMRSERVLTNWSCNQNCVYCDRRAPSDDPAFVSGDAVRRRIDDASNDGSVELVLSGGEPTLRSDLAALVQYARERASSVVLETNAALVTPQLAARLAAAGLHLARVNLSGADARLDAVTQDEGGFAATLEGARNLAAAGVAVEASVAVVRSTLPLLPGLPRAWARALGPKAGGFRVGVPSVAREPSEVLPLETAALAIDALEAEARDVDLPTALSTDSPIPPCVFPRLGRMSAAFALTRGGGVRAGFKHLDTCARCEAKDRCPGFPEASLQRFGAPVHQPITDARHRRRLSLISTVAEQIERELVEPSTGRDLEGAPVDEAIVRINFRCNQACEFCFVSTHLPSASDARIEEAIATAARAGKKLVISGGEPTLNPRVVDFVRLAATLSGKAVMLQTNAVRLGDGTLARELVEAGATEAFVSLHADDAALSDGLTSAPGTFARTVKGLDALSAAGATVIINFVISQQNHARLPHFVPFVAARWPKALLNLSFVAPMTDVVPHDARLFPRYSEVRPHLEAALRAAAELGVTVVGFESMCGLPLCQVPAATLARLPLQPVDEASGRGEFIKPDACRACALSGSCHGLRRRYAELHGTGELRAFAVRPDTVSA